MIGKLILALLNIIGKIVSLIVAPLDLLVSALLPDLSDVLTSISQFLRMPTQYMSWIFELVHVPRTALMLIVSYWVFKYAVIGAVWGVKKTITLYRRFKM